MCIDLAILAEPGVKPLPDGNARRFEPSQAPFAKASGRVAALFQDFSVGFVVILQVAVKAVAPIGIWLIGNPVIKTLRAGAQTAALL